MTKTRAPRYTFIGYNLMKDKSEERFLTEKSLGEFLTEFIPNGDWISQYKLPNSRFRVDWFSDILKLCVEFDGYQHYTSSKQIVLDLKKDELCSDLGIEIVRIPYFVQLSRSIIDLIFSLDIPNFKQTFPHGFISKKKTMVFPSDFCYLGIKRFESDLKKFSCIRSEILDSLKCRSVDKRIILPEPLFNLLN